LGWDKEKPLLGTTGETDFLQSTLADLSRLCAASELPMTQLAVNSALFAIHIPDPTMKRGTLKKMLDTITDRLPDELSTKLFFQVPHSRREFFENPLSGWEAVVKRFDACVRDVEEMNKCFALSRYIAAMYHALQVAEVGAIELGNKIGVTDPKKGWGPTTRRLSELVKSGHSKFDASMGVTFDFVEQMNREVETMKLAWRHKVDHAANHLAILPNSDFTPDVAEHIMKSVRLFMDRLVEELK
jgi:hypothetical protein